MLTLLRFQLSAYDKFGISQLTGNGLRLCEEAELKVQIFSLEQMFIRIPNVQFSTEPAFLQNHC